MFPPTFHVQEVQGLYVHRNPLSYAGTSPGLVLQNGLPGAPRERGGEETNTKKRRFRKGNAVFVVDWWTL